MILWLFGAVALASAFIIGGWSITAWRHRLPPSVWNSALLLAVAIDVGAIGVASLFGLRAADLYNGANIIGSYGEWITASLALILASKITLIWIASIRSNPRRFTALWPLYWLALGLWTIFVGVVI